jgi:SAM-dependent methyltransferase
LEKHRSMPIKSDVKHFLSSAGLQPAIARVLSVSTVRAVLKRLPGSSYLYANAWDRRHPFDVEHGTETSGYIPTAGLSLRENGPARSHSAPYGGSQPSVLRAALVSLPPLDTFTFVDLGCGKGRPLLVASEFPFREIIGVELSAPLAAIAQRNAAMFARQHSGRPPIHVAAGDASTFPMPAGNVVLFLYNPFSDELIAKVVKSVEAALATRPDSIIYVVYYNPVGGHCFDASHALRRRSARMIPYAPEELGYGPDEADALVIWQGGPAPAAIEDTANAHIIIVTPRIRTSIEGF